MPTVDVGFEIVASSKPVAGDHEYVNPATDAAPICTLVVVQVIVPSAPASAVGNVLFTVTVTSSVTVTKLPEANA